MIGEKAADLIKGVVPRQAAAPTELQAVERSTAQVAQVVGDADSARHLRRHRFG